MRIVGLRYREDEGLPVTLHPHLSVVTGVPVDARQRLAHALGELLLGSPEAELIATVDDAGRAFELRPGGTAVLQRRVDLLVRAGDIQARAHAGETGSTGSTGAEPTGEPLRKARYAATTAQASLAALEQVAAEAREAQQRTAMSLERARVAIQQAHHDLDPYAAAALDLATHRAERLETELGLPPGASRGDTLEAVKDRIVLLETQQRDIAAVLDLLAFAEPQPVADALDVVRVVTATGRIAPPEVLRLADEWSSISEHLAALEVKFAVEDGDVASVSDRLDAARERFAQTEVELTPAPASAEDVQALEAAHEKVLAAERRASSRLGGSRARRGLDEALAEEQIYLDRLGYPTWSAWIMGAPLLDATASRASAVEQAAQELDEATRAWERLTAKLEADPEFRSLLDRLERVLQAAYAIVGEVDDVEAALRGVRIDPGPPPCSVREARDALATALTRAGFAVDDGAPLDALRVQAERWLAEIRTVTALRPQLEIDVEHCAAELRRARETFERIEARGAADRRDGSGDPRLQSVWADLLAAEGRAVRHRAAITRVAHLVAESAGLAEAERQLQLAVDAREELLDATRAIVESSTARVRALEAAGGWQAPTDEEQAVIDVLDVRFAAARLAADGGPVPVLFDDALDGLPAVAIDTVLGWLETVSADTQLVYFSDHPAIVSWARRRSPDRVQLVDGAVLAGRA